MSKTPQTPTTEQLMRNPLLTDEGAAMLRQLQEHPCAPRWNHFAGDRLVASDLEWLDCYRHQIDSERRRFEPAVPTEKIVEWIERMRPRVPAFRERIPVGSDIARHWHAISTMSREDIATRIEHFIPDDADLEKMIVYRTAGTTGHALLVPHAARAAACYQPYLEYALSRYGVNIRFDASFCGCFLVGAQAQTVTYPTVLSAWNQTGFAKLNLNPGDWPGVDAPHKYFESFQPPLLTGDPISFAEMLRMNIPAKPKAMISTAVAMSAAVKAKLTERFNCPVIDWYSLTETGPLGYACPQGFGYHVLPHDVFLEAITEDGRPAAPGEIGEIAVTGGRNPFIPLLRYRTGDWGRIDSAPCSCGDPMPRILDLEGRKPVVFRTVDGAIVNPVDISRVLRDFPLVQHELSQTRDGSCNFVIRVVGPQSPALKEKLENSMHRLFGNVPITISFDPELGNRSPGGKVVPYRSEWLLED